MPKKTVNPKRIPIEAQMILESIDSSFLKDFSTLTESKVFEALKEFCRRYVETKRNQILDLQTEDERKFANEAALRKGCILGVGVLIDVIEGSKKELLRRKEE